MEDKHIEGFLNQDNQLTALEKLERNEQLVFYINHLVAHDFKKLVQILYTADVDEKKLKELLQQNQETDAAVIIADLLKQRQQEKVKTREVFKSNNDIPEEDKW